MTRRARRTVAAALAVLAVGTGVLIPSIVTHPPTASASTAGGPAGRSGALPLPEPLVPERLELVEQTTFVGPGSTFTIAVRVTDVSADATLSLTLHQPVANRIQLGSTLGGDDLGGVVQQTDAVPVRDLPTEADGVARLRFVIPDVATPGGADNPFALRVVDPGVYPVALTLTDSAGTAGSGSGSEVLVTHVVRPPNPPADPAAAPVPLSVATLVRLDADVAIGADGGPQVTPVSAARLAGIVDTLARTSVPTTVQTTGATLRAVADAEPSAPFAAALGERLLQPTWTPVSVTDLLTAGERGFLDRQLLTGSATTTAIAGTPGSPDVWVLDAGVDPDALTTLVSLGVGGVVVPETLASPLDSNRFSTTLTQSFTVTDGDGDAVPALQTDLVLTTLLNSTDQPALAANRVLADLAVLALDFPEVRRAAVLDTGPDVDPRALGLVLAGLTPGASGPAGTTSLLDGRTVSDALTVTTPVAGGLTRTWTADEPADLGAWPARVAATDADTASLVSTITPVAGGTRADQVVASVNQLTLASGQAGLTSAARARLLDDANELIDDTLAAIGIPAQGTVTLTADAGVVPITLENGLPDPVTVRLSVRSDKLEFPDGDELEVILDPGTNRREVAVRTRASGSFPVEVTLRTGDDRLDIATGRLSVRSTAFSGFGLVLSLLAGAFLAVWWALHLRSARRSRQLIDADSGTPVEEAHD